MTLPLEAKLTKDAAKFLESLERKTREAIKSHLTLLVNAPFDFPLSKPLRGRPERSCRVGDYRILFLVDEGSSVLLVVQIGHRKSVYGDH